MSFLVLFNQAKAAWCVVKPGYFSIVLSLSSLNYQNVTVIVFQTLMGHDHASSLQNFMHIIQLSGG